MAQGRVAGKTALVTGGGNGMGQAACIRLAQEGAHVAIVDIDEAGIAKTLSEIEGAGGTAMAVQCDVGDEASVQEATARVEAQFGPINILFNNAGVENNDGNTHELDLEGWEHVQRVNTRGVFLVGKYGIQSMLKGGGGSIIATASVGALIGGPGLHSYSASKGAVVSLTRSWAVTYARQGIRANVICPGLVLTPMVMRVGDEFLQQATAMTPLGRGAQPSEIGDLVLFLGSDESSFMTGAIIPIDGGLTAI